MDNKTRLNKSMVYGAINDEKRKGDHLKEIHDMNTNMSRDMYTMGENWFKNGLSFEEASIELQQNSSFKNGFERGKRLAYIQELNEKDNKKLSR